MKNKDKADDIYQNVFLKFIKQGNRIEPEEHLKAWLMRTTVNCCKDYWKSSWHRKVSYEEKAPKKKISLRKIYAIAGLVAAVIIVAIGVPSAITYGKNIYKSYSLVIGNRTVKMEPMEPVYFDIERFKSKEDVERMKDRYDDYYWVAFEDGNLLEDYTGMKLPEDKDFVFKDIFIGVSDKNNTGHYTMSVKQISTGQSALISAQFFANEIKDGDKMGYGCHNVKASFVYTLNNGSKAYFIWEGKDEPEEGIINTYDPDEYQTVYFCAHGIQYQMSIGRTEKQTKLAVDIMELLVK